MPIRLADDADLDLVTDLRLAFLADHRGVDPSTFAADFVTDTLAFVTHHHRAGTLLTWLADDDGTPAGIVSMLLRTVPPRPEARGTTEGYVINLYVPPDRRRRGVGRELFDALLRHARAERFRRLVLHYTDDGLPLYQEAGFAPDDRWLQLVP
jgi:GNAT superfamily N-acetyltransferase